MSVSALPCAFWGAYTLLAGLSAPAGDKITRKRAATTSILLGSVSLAALCFFSVAAFVAVEAALLSLQLAAAVAIIFTAPPKTAGPGVETLLLGGASRFLFVGLVACLALA